MHLHRLIFVLVSMGWVSDAQNCSATQKAEAKKSLFEHLGLNKSDSQNPKMWPLIFNKYDDLAVHPADIQLNLYVTSIINVNEKAQSLTTQVKMITAWQNWRWNETLFCGIKTFSAPKNMFWTPDIGIMESIKTEFGTKESPNVLLLSTGYTASSDFFALTTACKMDLYRFPFDTQSCNITLQSTTHTNQEITINPMTNQSSISDMSKQIQVQGEWELLSINYTKATMAMWIEMDQLIYQITMKRRPLLYVINIIVPVFFFLILDVISFFIDTNGPEKLNFKVTLLLSISVMLLLVNDTLPSTADKIPLIGVYCGAVFCLMGISIVETIFVNYLKTKGAEKRSVKTTDSVRVMKCPPDSVRDQNEEQSILDLLKQILTECRAATQQNQREKTSLCWIRVARIIDMTFLFLYVITVIVFLSVLGKVWIP